MSLWLELVASKEIESKGGQLSSNHTGPRITIGGNSLQGINDNPGEVNVTDNDDIVVPEESKLHQINSGLAVGPSGLTEVLDGPDNGEKHSAATDDVNKEEDLFPGSPVMAVGPILVNNDLSNVGNDLKGDDNDENLFFLILKEGFEEGPASANQDNESEERDALEEAENVKDDIPTVGASGALDVGFVLGLAQEIQGFQDNHG